MEILDDVINMSRLQGRADSSQLAPVQIMTVMDPDGAGTPITAWAGRGASGGHTGGTMDTSATGGGGNSGDRNRTPGSHSSTSSYASQYPAYGGLGSNTAAQSTPVARGGGSGSAHRNNYTPPPPASTFSTAVPDLGALTAQLAQALTAIQTLTQKNHALGQQNHDMGLKLRDMQLQMQRQQGEQEQATGDQMESSPPKRPREQEATEARSLLTRQRQVVRG